MAHFAKLGTNNKVIDIITVHNNELLDSNNIEQEAIGINFLIQLTGYPLWKQTSYNENFRKNFAQVGYVYDEDKDAFIAPKPLASWVLNEQTCKWEAPIPYPTDGQHYGWNEENQSWELIDLEKYK